MPQLSYPMLPILAHARRISGPAHHADKTLSLMSIIVAVMPVIGMIMWHMNITDLTTQAQEIARNAKKCATLIQIVGLLSAVLLLIIAIGGQLANAIQQMHT